ncbi:FecR family protein [Pararobbsia silviterrae]|uniref:DUF4880 domain-containing protein n=1 Tax=Pararobbsia silviterrae TaxID=1792498 RepID=A0A494XHW2_9BURK|nr:FecR domain-containing protein [Pararobbsia silviterrae]RKP47674.1 DUF4880 domain-containing protein [Pararobbsia silviterrae]
MERSTSTSRNAIPDAITAQAAEWIVRLGAGSDAEREQLRADFEAWTREDPRHARAAARMQDLVGRIEQVRTVAGGRPGPARSALNAARRARPARARKVIASIALACAIGLPTWLWIAHNPLAYLSADLRTSTGHWQTQTLPDGSRITLAADSAVDIRFDTKRRTLALVQGEILVEVAHDVERPFVVETGEGTIRALGTRFVVERHDGVTDLSMLQSRVAVQTKAEIRANSNEAVFVEAGQHLRITADGTGPLEPVDARSLEAAWASHDLVVRNRPLPEVLDELNRYRRGAIVYDRAQIEGLNVAAVLPLDDTDRSLQLLADSLPMIRIREFTPWLVIIDAPAR